MDELVLYYDIADNRWRRCNLHHENRKWNQNMQCMEKFFNGKYLGPIDFSCIQIELPFLAEEYRNDDDKRVDDDYYINHYYMDNYIDSDDFSEMMEKEIDEILNGNSSEEQYLEWECLKFAVRGVIERKGEDGAVNFLQQYTQGSDLLWQNDLCRIIYEWFDKIPADLLVLFWDKGLERSIYDKLVKGSILWWNRPLKFMRLESK